MDIKTILALLILGDILTVILILRTSFNIKRKNPSKYFSWGIW